MTRRKTDCNIQITNKKYGLWAEGYDREESGDVQATAIHGIPITINFDRGN